MRQSNGLTKKEIYNNNINLKRTGVELEFTDFHLKEIARCKKDIFYFAQNYVKIVTLDKGIQPFVPYDYQKRIIKTILNNRFTVILSSRQSGKTTTCLLPILHGIVFNNNWAAAILADKKENAKNLLDRLKMMYEELPIWLKHGVKEWQKSSIELENGSFVIAEATTPNSGRSHTFNYLFLDEFAIVPDRIANEFYAATYPTISSGTTTKIVISSTPKGFNLFYKIYTEAVQKRNLFKPIAVRWDEVPNRDINFKKETIKNIGRARWESEYECKFLGSNNTLIEPSYLELLTSSAPIKKEESLWYFEEPVSKNTYLITADISEGIGLDYTAVIVIDIASSPNKVVCAFKNNKIRPLNVAHLIYKLAKYYNNAYILLENNYGNEVNVILYENYYYENLLGTKISQAKQCLASVYEESTRLGVTCSPLIKRTGCNVLKTLVEENKLILNDERIVSEFYTYVRSGNNYEAESGYNDDMISALVIYSWATMERYFRDVIDGKVKDRLILEGQEKIDADFPYLGKIPYEENLVVEDGAVWTVSNYIPNYNLANNKDNILFFNNF